MKLSPRLRPFFKKHSLRTTFKIAALLALVSAPHVGQGALFTYTGGGVGTTTTPVSGNFSGAGFSPTLGATASTAPASTYADTLLFGGTAYTATDDFTSQILANTLTFSNTGVVSLARGGAGTSNSISLGGTAPTINLNNTGSLTDALDLSLAATATVTGTGSMTISGVVSGTGFGLTKSGAGTLTLTGINTYTGATTVNLGILSLAGANGALALSTSPITISGGEFRLDNSVTNNNARLATTQTFSMNGGLLDVLTATTGGTTTETFGAASATSAGPTGAAQSTIAVQPQGTGAGNITFASIARTAGQSIILLDGVGLGKDSASTTSVGRIFATTAPTLIGTTAALATGDGTNGTGAGAAKNTVIVPYLLGETTATTAGALGGVGNANTFLTYNATTGFRPLNPTDEFTLNAITAGNNTYITTATTAAASAAINSLVINGNNLSISNTFTLTNTSGAVLFASSNSVQATSGTATFALGSAEGIFTVNSGTANFGSTAGVLNLTGSAGFTKSGAGTLQLNSGTTTNTNQALTGPITILQGILVNKGLASLNVPGASAITVANGATFQVNDHAGGSNLAFANAFTLNGFGGGNGAINDVNSGLFSYTGTISLASDAGIRTDNEGQGSYTASSGTLTGGITFSNIISSPTGVTSGLTLFAQQNTGVANVPIFVLSGANTYTGTTVLTSSSNGNSTGAAFYVQLTGGTNRLPSATNLVLGGNPTGVAGTFNSNVTLLLNGVAQTVASVTTAGTGTYSIAGGSATASTFTINNAAADTFGGIIGGTGFNNNTLALAKSGVGTLTLSGTSTYTGGTSISAGTVNLIGTQDVGTSTVSVTGGSLGLGNGTTNGNLALVAGNGVTLASGTSLAITQTNSSNLTYAAFPITMNGNATVSFNGGNTFTTTLTSPITLSNTSGSQTATLSESDAQNTINLQGVISGTGDLLISAGGISNNLFLVTLNQPEVYAGKTTIQSNGGDIADIRLLTGGSLPSATILTLNANSATGNYAQFDLNGQSQTLAGLTSAGTAANDRVINSTNATTSTLTINGTTNTTYGGVIGGGTGLNNIALTKLGSSTLTLTGTNPYTGATTVSAGTLALGSGGNLGATAVTVASGATFAATPGTTGASNALTGSLTLSAGSAFTMADNATSTFNVTGASVLAPGTGTAPTLTFDIGGTTTAVDKLAFTGAATIGASRDTINLNVIGTTTPAPGTYTLISAASGLNGSGGPILGGSNKVSNASTNTAYPLSLTNTATAVVLNVGAGGVDQAYYSGAAGTPLNAGAANFNTTATSGTPVSALPSAVTDVFFTTTTPTPTNLTTTLGQNFTFDTLTFTATAPAVTIDPDGKTLTINGNLGTGITDSSTVTQTINAPVALGASQTWKGGTATNPLTIGGAVTGSTFVLTLASGSNVVLGGGGTLSNIANSGTLTITGAQINLSSVFQPVNGSVLNLTTGGVLNLTNSNSVQPVAAAVFTINVNGGKIVTAGPLRLNHSGGAGAIYLNTGEVDLGGAFASDSNRNGSTVNFAGATIKPLSSFGDILSGISPGLASNITLNEVAGGGGAVIDTNGFNLGIAEVINKPAIGTDGGLTKNGAGTLTLSAANTYNGGTTVNAGTLALGNGGTFGTAGVANNANVSFVNTNALTVGNLISGAGTLTQSGTGTTKLTAANTYSGATSISAGALTLANASAAQNSIVTVTDPGDLFFDTVTAGSTSFKIAGLAGNQDVALNDVATPATAVALTVGNGQIAGTSTYSGVLSSGGAGSLTKTGTAIQVLSGLNTYTGTTTVNQGTLQAGSSSAFGVNSAVTIANPTTPTTATLDLNGNNVAIGSLAGGGASGNVTLGSGTLTTGGNNTDTNFDGVISGTGGLTKVGTGTQTLTGTNTYGGATTVSAGTLIVDGDHSGATGDVGVGTNGTLGGRGTIGGATTVDGTITGATNGTIGTLTLASSLMINGTYVADLSSTDNTSDLLQAGALNLGANSTLTIGGTVVPATAPGSTIYVLATYNSLIGTFSNFTAPSGYAIDYGSGGPGGEITLEAIPEPSTWLGGFLLVGGIGFAQRRRLSSVFRLAKAA